MAMPKEFEHFKSLPSQRARAGVSSTDRDFASSALGLSMVWDNHGRYERGNDVIFAEMDRFGDVLYSGIQVKFRDELKKSDSGELIDDIREAFTSNFDEPRKGVKG